ncbi:MULTISPECIES: YbhB/YbcL family Raf kinase inhibitor-like protein [Paraburkholderia]|jgi:Raf kinase inhibitor-like YbhB/YbcL family protein|uniref:YbhB/YbcL family Raf kinase inhibitor-like protein n=1 Tax=Paraburkholderia TaxID=1822464 RepID=UPI001559BE9A|nr:MULTISPECIES: YbhB/YbcL family Raf kinase inhibitor-like protein [Paraburkholderia]MCX4170253.1 YbhB/YbcL family Raf kinase inhibitor-like protein [Paraburkholderia madseniana]MDQ6458265.1 YbhB/YbcL family Raf kinase inhibitor-like protein [Paraburkholderia madseniana]NPT69978.1 YbhB/YbcL family Raf kinase inhibitor-like protein [Paraburkholderia madseniana]
MKLLCRLLSATSLSILLAASAVAQPPTDFKLSSPDIAPGGKIDNKFVLNAFGCTGGNVSPALVWKNAPAGTRSFALQVYDPDAPSGSGWWHWTVYNIPAAVTQLPRGAGNDPSRLPVGANPGMNDFQDTGAVGSNGNYGGPCPPVGDKPHRYIFTLYALSVDDFYAAAGIPKTGTAALHGFALDKALGDKVLGKASFAAYYGR